MTVTPNLNLTLPTVGADSNTWGGELNADLTAIDAIFSASGTPISLNAPTIAGALTYGGVTLAPAVTGTGQMVLDTNPTFSAGVTVTGVAVINSGISVGSSSNQVAVFNSIGALGAYATWSNSGSPIGDFGYTAAFNPAARNGMAVGSRGGIVGFYIGSTEAGSFDSNGLLVGTTTSGGWSGGSKLEVKQSSNGTAISAWQTNVTGRAILARVDVSTANFLDCYYGATNIGNLSAYSTGDFGINTPNNLKIIAGTSGGVQLSQNATSWSSLSDYRAKKDHGIFDGAAAIVQGVPVHSASMNDDDTNTRKAMFFAHELQGGVAYSVHGTKDAVDEKGNHVFQMIDTTDPLVPVLWAALQNALNRIDALESAR